ncbi:hypothetical protein LAZ67_18000876, partial [Cordylochernes scorpioides]
MVERDPYRSQGFMVWAGIFLGGRTALHIFRQGTLTGQRYRDEILAAYVMPQALEMGENVLLMYDNARPHRAGVVNTFLQNHAIARMNWPARSPDLNPIEHLIMSLRKVLADDLKWRAVGRMEAGQSQVEVAKWLNVNKSVVSKIWKHFIETGTIKRKEGSGRKRKTATSEDRYLVVTAKRHREMTSATGTGISRQTVYQRLHEGALYARRPMVCIPLTSAHRRARLNWCLEHHAWTHDQWANVLFSDESRFSLNTDSRRVFIWREPGTRYHPSNIREIDSFRGGSLLVWAGISSSRRTPLHIFSGGTLTAQRYRDEILEPYLRPYRDQIGHNLIFMDDNARPHRARLVNEYLQ